MFSRPLLLLASAAAIVGAAQLAVPSRASAEGRAPRPAAQAEPAHPGSCPRSAECHGEGCSCPLCQGGSCQHGGQPAPAGESKPVSPPAPKQPAPAPRAAPATR